METWNIQKILNWTTQHFEGKNIPSARLDAELLLAKTLNCKRLDLYMRFDQPVGEKELGVFKEFIKRRAQFEPVAYILERQEFYGRNFNVGPGVLIPRPETEFIIDEVLKNKSKGPFKILDVATGSGCIAATLAAELPEAKITAVDVSLDVKKFCEKNFKDLKVDTKIDFVLSDFEHFATQPALGGVFDIVVSNPPYISENAPLMEDVKNHEPALALYGGEVGDEVLKKWIPLMLKLCKAQGMVICEIGHDQKNEMEKYIKSLGYQAEFIRDYSGVDRILKVIKNG